MENLNSVNLKTFLRAVEEGIAAEELSRSPRDTSQADLGVFFSDESLTRCSPCGEKNTTFSTCTKIDTQTNPSISLDMVSRFITADIEALKGDGV